MMKIYEKYSTRFNEIKHNIIITEKKLNKLHDLIKDYIKLIDKEDITIIDKEINKCEENKQKYIDNEIEYCSFIKNLEESKEVFKSEDKEDNKSEKESEDDKTPKNVINDYGVPLNSNYSYLSR